MAGSKVEPGLGPVLYDDFIDYLDDGSEKILTEFSFYMKLRQTASSLREKIRI